MEIKSIPSPYSKRLTGFTANIEILQRTREGYLAAVLDAMDLEGEWQFDPERMAFVRQSPETTQIDSE